MLEDLQDVVPQSSEGRVAAPERTPARRRLRPLRNPMSKSGDSPPSNPREAKTARTQDDDEMTSRMEELNILEEQIRKEKLSMDTRILAMIISNVDVTEVFSPARITEMAESMGLIGGIAVDLKTGWGFSRQSDWRRAVEHTVKEDPWLIVGSPPCPMFGMLQNPNIHKNDDA